MSEYKENEISGDSPDRTAPVPEQETDGRDSGENHPNEPVPTVDGADSIPDNAEKQAEPYQEQQPAQQDSFWQERPNPEQQIDSWQNMQNQQNQPNQPQYPGQQNQPNQPQYPGQQNQPNQPQYPGQQNAPWQNMQNQQFPNYPNQGGGNFYQNPNFQNGNFQNPNMQNPNLQGQPGNRPPANPMAITSLVLGIISMLVSCCCFPIGFIIGFVLAMVGLVLAISSKKGKPFSGYAIAGLVLSILGICESLFLFFSYLITARMMQDPNFSHLMNQLMEQYERSMGPQMINSILRRFW